MRIQKIIIVHRQSSLSFQVAIEPGGLANATKGEWAMEPKPVDIRAELVACL
jgi:hypothetical protein